MGTPVRGTSAPSSVAPAVRFLFHTSRGTYTCTVAPAVLCHTSRAPTVTCTFFSCSSRQIPLSHFYSNLHLLSVAQPSDSFVTLPGHLQGTYSNLHLLQLLQPSDSFVTLAPTVTCTFFSCSSRQIPLSHFQGTYIAPAVRFLCHTSGHLQQPAPSSVAPAVRFLVTLPGAPTATCTFFSCSSVRFLCHTSRSTYSTLHLLQLLQPSDSFVTLPGHLQLPPAPLSHFTVAPSSVLQPSDSFVTLPGAPTDNLHLLQLLQPSDSFVTLPGAPTATCTLQLLQPSDSFVTLPGGTLQLHLLQLLQPSDSFVTLPGAPTATCTFFSCSSRQISFVTLPGAPTVTCTFFSCSSRQIPLSHFQGHLQQPAPSSVAPAVRFLCHTSRAPTATCTFFSCSSRQIPLSHFQGTYSTCTFFSCSSRQIPLSHFQGTYSNLHLLSCSSRQIPLSHFQEHLQQPAPSSVAPAVRFLCHTSRSTYSTCTFFSCSTVLCHTSRGTYSNLHLLQLPQSSNVPPRVLFDYSQICATFLLHLLHFFAIREFHSLTSSYFFSLFKHPLPDYPPPPGRFCPHFPHSQFQSEPRPPHYHPRSVLLRLFSF
ncbi:hypothetical protein C7M84_012987 [Penaeus vannamei]|uniref:Uncharacterized protein n=1 Tax=Penaeus vannamei TaxID=6689 RepID=A0A3R7QIT7_PENVA|nr:hypothetical protein C7M84_012987 [Penaeus vannamei]